MPISEIIGIASEVIGFLKPKQPTPAEQKQKAGVWYSMLENWVKDTPSNAAFISRWQNLLPFKQSSTKNRFMSENILNRSFEYVQDVLVNKINDELVKGGLAILGKESILAGINGGKSINPIAVNPTGGTVTSSLLPATGTQEKNKNVLFGLVLFAVAIVISIVAYTSKK